MTISQAQNMSNDSQVDTVVANCPVYLDGTRNIGPSSSSSYSPGIDLVDQQNFTPNYQFNFNNTGQNVHVYVVDTGIKASHVEFAGKVIDGVNLAYDRDVWDFTDDKGHGTAVASVIAGNIVGVAPNVKLHAVRIFSQYSETTDQGTVCQAIDWIMKNKPTNSTVVVNCSFGEQQGKGSPFGSSTHAQDTAIRKLSQNGAVVVASAGNENKSAEKHSPGGTVGELIVVSATDLLGSRASYANYGNRVDLFASGVTQAASSTGTTGYRYFNGTSTATPLVAGVAALYLESPLNRTKTCAQVQDWLVSNATNGILNSGGAYPLNASPNKMLYKGSL